MPVVDELPQDPEPLLDAGGLLQAVQCGVDGGVVEVARSKPPIPAQTSLGRVGRRSKYASPWLS